MSTIRVASASSLFQEQGHNSEGLFRLLCNAITREYTQSLPTVDPFDYSAGFSTWTIKDTMVYATGILGNWQDFFKGDLDFADKRIKQYFDDYARLKELNAEISKLSIWDYLFRRHQDVKKLFAERRELENMTVESSELLEIAYFKYAQCRLGNKEKFIQELNDFLEANSK